MTIDGGYFPDVIWGIRYLDDGEETFSTDWDERYVKAMQKLNPEKYLPVKLEMKVTCATQ